MTSSESLDLIMVKEMSDLYCLLVKGCGKGNGLRSLLMLILCSLHNTSLSNPFSESEARWSSRLSKKLYIQARGDLRGVLRPTSN